MECWGVGWEELSPTRYFPWLGQPYLRKMGGRQKDSGGLGGPLVCLEMESGGAWVAQRSSVCLRLRA